jgi:ABC-2 type transporter
MSGLPAASAGLFRHFLLCLELSLRSKQALIYGYVVPLLFLVAFGSVFRAETPALLGEMGQLLTITILGGACFGMPTSLVAERERGIWRRYRLLPVVTGGLVGGVVAARLLIVASAALVQVGAAHFIYHTPLPLHPFQAAASVVIVTASFLGLGLLVAALADDVPSVQALGQCLFLPMIMIGGVGIPLLALPSWAQEVSGFMPGRYAVEVLELSYNDPDGISRGGYGFAALGVIGLAAALAGAALFRWEPGRRPGRTPWVWLGVALGAWLAVGAGAGLTGRLGSPVPSNAGYAAVTEAQIDEIGYGNLPGDAEFVSRLAPPLSGPESSEMQAFAAELRAWPPGQVTDSGQRVRNLLAVAGIADVSQDIREGDVARLVFDDLRADYGDERLGRVLAWIILYPQVGTVPNSAPELGLGRQFREDIVRQRIDLYARKFLGRLRGKIRD